MKDALQQRIDVLESVIEKIKLWLAEARSTYHKIPVPDLVAIDAILMKANAPEPLYTSEEICEALVRHVETTGSEVFEKNFVKDDMVLCTVWCMIGPNAEAFQEMVVKWLTEQGFKLD